MSLIPERENEIDDFRDQSAPDAALSGPRLFSEQILSSDSLRKHVELVKLRAWLMELTPSHADKAVGMLKDEWFAARDTKRNAFAGFAALKISGRSAETSEVIRFLLSQEEDVDRQTILKRCGIKSVSYTHLTLPTNREV